MVILLPLCITRKEGPICHLYLKVDYADMPEKWDFITEGVKAIKKVTSNKKIDTKDNNNNNNNTRDSDERTHPQL